MKNLAIISALIIGLVVSCTKPNADGEDQYSNQNVINSAKYQMEAFQKEDLSYYVIYVNKFTGDVYVWNQNQTAFKVAIDKKLPAYKYPTYSIKLIKTANSEPTIVLSDNKTASIYAYPIGLTAGLSEVTGDLKQVIAGGK